MENVIKEGAHPFISKKYWYSKLSMEREQLLQVEIFVYETDRKIQGFIGMVDKHIAGICIDTVCSLGMCAERNTVVMSNGAVVLFCGAHFECMMKLDEGAGEMEILIDYVRM